MRSLVNCILMCFLLQSCTKETIFYDNFNSVPSVFKNMFSFKEGSYWIYQEQHTHEIDSVVFDHEQRLYFPDGPEYNFINEIIEAIYYSYRENKYIEWRYYSGDLVTMKYLSRRGESFAQTVLKYPVKNGEKYGDLKFFIHDSIKINNTYYYQTIEVFNKRDYLHEENSTKYYFAPNYGMIRFQNLDKGEQWDLIRSRLIK